MARRLKIAQHLGLRGQGSGWFDRQDSAQTEESVTDLLKQDTGQSDALVRVRAVATSVVSLVRSMDRKQPTPRCLGKLDQW